MKRNKTTKMTAVLLCVAMLLMALVSGCGGLAMWRARKRRCLAHGTTGMKMTKEK